MANHSMLWSPESNGYPTIENFDVGTSTTDIHVFNANKIAVKLLRKDGQLKKMLTGSVSNSNYEANFGTTVTLQPGDSVEAMVSGPSSTPGQCSFSPRLPPPGRFQTIFTAGQVLAQEDAEFSKPNMYLGFNLDRTWTAPCTMENGKCKNNKIGVCT